MTRPPEEVPRDCQHGSLARSCEMCERDAEIARLVESHKRLEVVLRRVARYIECRDAADAVDHEFREAVKPIMLGMGDGTWTDADNERRNAVIGEFNEAKAALDAALAEKDGGQT